jgi:hypothetical protein
MELQNDTEESPGASSMVTISTEGIQPLDQYCQMDLDAIRKKAGLDSHCGTRYGGAGLGYIKQVLKSLDDLTEEDRKAIRNRERA